MKSPVTIAILGANPIAVEGMVRVLAEHDFKVIETAGTLEELESSRLVTSLDNHLILIEAGNYGRGMELVERVVSDIPAAKVVLLAEDFDLEAMVACFRAGGHGYVVKKMSVEPLIASLRLVAMGEKIMPSLLASVISDILPENSAATTHINQSMEGAGLSSREAEILHCLIEGHPNKVISRQLSISEATVKVHVKAILRKVGVQNRTQAAIWAVAEKWPEIAQKKAADDDFRRPPFKCSEAAAA